MAQRSRIANNRRGSDRGAKRIDEMRNRLSVLRGLNDAEVEKISLLEKELSEIGTSTKMVTAFFLLTKYHMGFLPQNDATGYRDLSQ